MFIRKFNNYCGWILESTTIFILLGMCGLSLFKMSFMQRDDFFGSGIAVAGVFFAICSIMYARAALTFSNDAARKYALEAAEDSFIGTLLAIFYFACSSIVFYVLLDGQDYPPVTKDTKLGDFLPVPTFFATVLYLAFAAPACVKLRIAVEKTIASWKSASYPT